MRVSKKAYMRAWKLVKDAIDDEEKYVAFRQGFPIEIRGSKGTLFIIYPNGNFVKAGKKSPKVGSIRTSGKFASPDYLATLINWIRFKEEQFEKEWNCGKFSLWEKGKNPEDRIIGQPNSTLIIGLVIAVISIVVATLVGALIVSNLGEEITATPIENSTNISSPPDNQESARLIDMGSKLFLTLPIVLFGAVIIGALAAYMGYMGWR